MKREEIVMQIQSLTNIANRQEKSGNGLKRLGGNYGQWELEKAKELRAKIAVLQGKLDEIDNPDEIFY